MYSLHIQQRHGQASSQVSHCPRDILMIMYLQYSKKLHGVNRKGFGNALKRNTHPSKFTIKSRNLDVTYFTPMTAAAYIFQTAISLTPMMIGTIGKKSRMQQSMYQE